jgi:hypothetical protein
MYIPQTCQNHLEEEAPLRAANDQKNTNLYCATARCGKTVFAAYRGPGWRHWWRFVLAQA